MSARVTVHTQDELDAALSDGVLTVGSWAYAVDGHARPTILYCTEGGDWLGLRPLDEEDQHAGKRVGVLAPIDDVPLPLAILSVEGEHLLSDLMDEIADVNRANGWYETARTFGEDVALLHSEVSEAFEGYRKGDAENVREELADVLIRLLDTWHRLGYTGDDLESVVRAKVERNRSRGHKHGGKAI